MHTSKAVFTTLLKKFVEILKLLCSFLKKTKTPTFFSRKVIFFQDFLWLRRQKFFTQCPEIIKNSDGFFCQLCWQIFDWMPKSICSVCENYENYLIFFSNKAFQYEYMIPWTRRKQFSQPCRKAFARGLKVFHSLVKTVTTPTIFSKKGNFFPRFPVDMWNSVLAILLDFFQQKTEKVCPKNENHKKNTHFFPKKLNKNIPLDTLNTVFTTEHFLLVVQNGQRKVFSFKKFSSNFFYLEVKCTFLDRPEKRLPEGPVFSCQSPQKNWKLT